jgi:hypothetical protein
MLYPSPSTLKHHVANIAGTLVVGTMFALIGLNVASGCGQRSGACIGPRDFLSGPAVEADLPTAPVRHQG